MVGIIRGFFGFLRWLGPNRASDWGGVIARAIGPLLPVHRIALANIRAAYPEADERRVQEIALGAWENLGRTGAEYAHLDTLFDYDHANPKPNGRIEIIGMEHLVALRDDGRPGILFSAHTGNWELSAIYANKYNLEMTAVFRMPNAPAVAQAVHEIRSKTMGNMQAARRGAAFAMLSVLEKGTHLGMLIDQHFTRGVTLPFFNRPALTNPTLGKFARRFDCPVVGARVIRLPGHRFRIELTPPLDLPRDAEGLIDPMGAMAAMTAVVEGWVREYPEQWLWMHRRWRVPASKMTANTSAAEQ